MAIEKYQTMVDFANDSAAIGVMKSVVVAVPVFFPFFLFLFWTMGTAASYFAVLKTTGKKRFWQSLTGMSFASFIISLVIASMNDSTVTFLSGYWVGFYILMTLGSWYALSQYK